MSAQAESGSGSTYLSVKMHWEFRISRSQNPKLYSLAIGAPITSSEFWNDTHLLAACGIFEILNEFELLTWSTLNGWLWRCRWSLRCPVLLFCLLTLCILSGPAPPVSQNLDGSQNRARDSQRTSGLHDKRLQRRILFLRVHTIGADDRRSRRRSKLECMLKSKLMIIKLQFAARCTKLKVYPVRSCLSAADERNCFISKLSQTRRT